ncbi:Ig-like domain-containing protein [Algibacillus agarilyticus]|uniref:Ig-like domain-containing protein n=1 Tax=Algibacillus agarilyticus TaxID=2234133 RepID=UPI000DD0D6D8|nr:Ig-like domain-containing protein [Algibacillus agarilyticus]
MNMLTKIKPSFIHTCLSVFLIVSSCAVSAADYPPNIDYGEQGDFVVKRGEAYGRTAILMPIGPVMINLPEFPGSSMVNIPDATSLFDVARDTAWDLSDLTNPTLIRQLSEDGQSPSMPIHAHATVIRVDEGTATQPGFGPLLYARGAGDIGFDPSANNSNEQLFIADIDGTQRWGWWGYDPISYTHLTAPYFVRNYWDYNLDTQGEMAIRDTANIVDDFPDDSFLGYGQRHGWLGEVKTHWDHLGTTGVSGFSTWLGNLLVVASDQQSTGLAIYDVAGFQEGREPRLLSVYQPQLTEPNAGNETNNIGIGGYWVESYGANKMVFSARARDNGPRRLHPAMFIVDFTNPSQPQLSCELYFDLDKNDTRDGDASSDPMYVNFQDQYAYVDHFKIDMDACEAAYIDKHISPAEFEQIVYKFNDIANQCDSSQYFRPLGQVGIFGGYDWWETDDINEQGMCFFVTDDEPDTRAPYVAGHRPLDGQTDYPIDGLIQIHIPETLRSETLVGAVSVYESETNQAVAFRLQLSHTGILGVWPDQYLAPNTEYTVDVSGIRDFMGNEMAPYSFNFMTDNGDLFKPTLGEIGGEPSDVTPSYTGVPYFPNKSSQLVCQPDAEDNDLWVVNPDNDSVSIFSVVLNPNDYTKTHELRREVKLLFEKPTSVSQINGLFAVTHADDDKVVFYNADGFPQFTIDTGHGTHPIASVADGYNLYVALYGSGEVVKLNVSRKEVSQRLDVGPTPKAMALFADRLLVTRFISTPEQGQVYDINIAQEMALTQTIALNKLLIPDDIFHGAGVPNYLSSIVINADGSEAYVTANKANIDRGLQRNGLPLDDDNTIRPMLATIDLISGLDINIDPTTREGTFDFDNKADPSGVTLLADPNIRAYTLRGNNVVMLSNQATNQSALITTGFAPSEMCTTLRTLYVKNYTERSITAIDVADFMHSQTIQLQTETLHSVTEEKLTDQALLGLQTFYHSDIPAMGREGYMTCASCHADGSHDGMTWDITSLGEGMRNTLSLNGASGTRFGNLHWSANFDEVQDFEIQLEQLNGGEGLIPDITFLAGMSPLDHISGGQSETLDALAAYVNGLGKETVSRSPYREYSGELSASALKGQQIFNEQGCVNCHTGRAFRDGLTHDVGTIKQSSGSHLGGALTAIRTPSLIELWTSAPYFHDGSALTLADVFTEGDHNVDITEQAQNDLINYLMSIDRELYIDDE